MELLIPGLILVGLMVYASTRIKRTAAEAFNPETVETDDFAIEKPEGFLNVVRHDPTLAFDAYSKNFGVNGAEEFREARAEIRVFTQRGVRDVIVAIKDTANVVSDISEIIGERKYHVLETETTEKGIGFRNLYKVAESGGRVFELKFTVLEQGGEELTQKVEKMVGSFTVK